MKFKLTFNAADFQKFKLVLSPAEYDTLMDVMIFVTLQDPPAGIKDKIVLCLVQSFYVRLQSKALIKQRAYNFTIPIAEAMAFQAFWSGKPARDIISSNVVNTIIGEVDRKTKSITF
ncbi:hypothetical protein F0L74_06045 [Chitinophaga agrisoli]|uniref:Uncharacterized protein n=1 Tax=Chitinophaga agrisoli TaxID=2607653 RepID=A0A5B2W3T4_9BACT|nr:hypothetical protein [Chitinophaga agrisoli]KAA2245518.1 hypothetical protein F0L74_06045 [Chitinophaga agrisoli]